MVLVSDVTTVPQYDAKPVTCLTFIQESVAFIQHVDAIVQAVYCDIDGSYHGKTISHKPAQRKGKSYLVLLT